MFAAFIANVLEAYRNPRASARRLLSRRPTMRDVVLMLVLTYAISEIIARIMSGALLGGGAGLHLPAMAAGLVLLIVAFAIMTVLAHAIGAKFGGKASLKDIAVVIAWHGLATQAMGPATYLGLEALRAGQGGLMLLVLLIMLGVSLWMFASFIAEAHRFARVGPVIGVTLGVSTGILLLVSMLLAGFMGQTVPVQ